MDNQLWNKRKIDGIDLRLKSIIFQALLAVPAMYDIDTTTKQSAILIRPSFHRKSAHRKKGDF
ncbi:hypothetical protein [Xenorhabdus sp. PB62.4]|uniref:hypothetical protein n=1 Tax=Xenorhabdus sp. PB62.4 TaxID=1851573 RepID=UPI001656ACBC|nr:hypothetical protein [Xenorhabdus sp. PB62.4]